MRNRRLRITFDTADEFTRRAGAARKLALGSCDQPGARFCHSGIRLDLYLTYLTCVVGPHEVNSPSESRLRENPKSGDEPIFVAKPGERLAFFRYCPISICKDRKLMISRCLSLKRGARVSQTRSGTGVLGSHGLLRLRHGSNVGGSGAHEAVSTGLLHGMRGPAGDSSAGEERREEAPVESKRLQ